MIRALALVACLLTVCITASSAFIRHWQNGVGCEGWPDCYRSWSAPPATAAGAVPGRVAPEAAGRSTVDAAIAAAARLPSAKAPPPIRIARSLHRVSATLTGVLVLLVVVFGWSSMGAGARIASVVALADTVFLSWLGRYTPHDLPLVTLGNLVGGFALAAALAWIAATRARGGGVPGVRALALAALAVLALLAWGGTMIGAHQAIDACASPLCASGARFDFAAFDPLRAGIRIDEAAARGLHVAHRVAGLALALMVGLLAWRLRAMRGAMAAWLALLAAGQLLLGVGTALGLQPLATTTLHNAVAALLAVALAAAAGGAGGRAQPPASRSASPRSA